MSDTVSDTVVVGGGLVGLALAYELACLGQQVTLIDGSLPGRATAAGAGILSPTTTADDDPEWWTMVQACGVHYPQLLARLASDEVDIEPAQYAVCGILSIGLRASEEDWFAPFAALVTRRAPNDVHEVSRSEARTLFPALGAVHRVLHHPGAARVDGRGMAAALRHGVAGRGVRIIEDVVVGLRVNEAGRRVESAELEGGESVRGEQFAVCGGAWSAAMGEWLGSRLPVTPTKGQIMHLQSAFDTGSWPIAQPLLSHYIVPWSGGRVACGGTFEVAAGFDVAPTAAGLHELLRECLLIAPGLAAASYIETRVGLRPTSVDDRPVVGRVPSWSNAWVATGHGANGLLQGPYGARVLAHEMTGVALAPDEPALPSYCLPDRFGLGR
jgi:D-amino-acid dehydrogenase